MTSKTSGFDLSPQGRHRRSLYLWAGALAVVLLAAYFTFTGQDDSPDSEARISLVEIGSIENTIAASGSLQPSEYVDVGAQVSGQLQQLYVEVGDVVEQGQLLAEIDARVQAARVEASRASIEALEAQIAAREASLTLARANAERQARLMAADATSQLDYDNAMNALASAESSLIQLQKQIEQNLASLESSETELEFTRIYAPMAGTIVSVFIEEGRTLNANQQAPLILRIADLSTMTVEADISEADIGDIKSGMDVYFTTLGGGARRWYSKVRQILPTPNIENNVVLYTGLFDIANDDDALLPEMTAQVYFVTASARDVLTIPMGAVTFIERTAQRNGPGNNRPGLNRVAAGEQGDLAPNRPAARQLMGFPSAIGAETERPGPPGRNLQAGDQEFDAETVRPALVTTVDEAGNQSTQRVLVGVTSRIAAEIVAGLNEGDRVVSGVVQLQRPDRFPGEGGGPPGGFAGRRPF